MRHLLKFALVCVLLSPHCYAASPDCTVAKTSLDKAICANGLLSQLGERLSRQYNKLIESLDQTSSEALEKEQTEWLATREQHCKPDNESCLLIHYNKRLFELKNWSENSGSDNNDSVTDLATKNSKPLEAKKRSKSIDPNNTDSAPESVTNKSKPLKGEHALRDLLKKGLLRKATREDYHRWAEKRLETFKGDLPEVVLGSVLTTFMPGGMSSAYVILSKITVPIGSHATAFFVEEGVPLPDGELEKINLYDFNTMSCRSAVCRLQDRELARAKPGCAFEGLELADNTVILAGGEYSGKPTKLRIVRGSRTAGEFSVVVNSPEQPVALLLGAYESSIWQISWTPGTRVEAVVITGHPPTGCHRLAERHTHTQ